MVAVAACAWPEVAAPWAGPCLGSALRGVGAELLPAAGRSCGPQRPASRRNAVGGSCAKPHRELCGDRARKDVTSQARVKVAIYKQVIARVAAQLSLRQRRILLFISPRSHAAQARGPAPGRAASPLPAGCGTWPRCAARPWERGLLPRQRGSSGPARWAAPAGFGTGSGPSAGIPLAAADAPDHTHVHTQTPHVISTCALF